MPLLGFHPVSLAAFALGIIISLWAQWMVRSAYSKYSKVGVRSGITGAEIARRMMRAEGIDNVGLEIVPGEMTDHYDPTKKVVRLSQDVYHGQSIASLGISAHEVGHVIQDARGYAPMRLRGFIYPVSNIGSTLAFPLAIGGLLFSAPGLVTIGIWLFAAALAFTLITLPVEFNASSRAVRALAQGGVMTDDELRGTKRVLNAAAMTYVAAAATAVLQLVQLLVLRNALED